jgi:predicted enzyme related to lactoylglutathione lyase
MRFHGVMAMVLVEDVDRATRFYRDTLGFTIQDESEDWVVFNEGVGLQVSPEPLPEHSVAVNAVQIALTVESVHEAYDELIKRGVPFFLPPMESGGMTFATLRDTEGNLVQIVEMG